MSSPTAEHPYHPAVFGDDRQRRVQNLHHWRRHSRRIRLLRRLLPAAMALILAVVLGWAAFNAWITPMTAGGPNSGTSIRMINPRFYGRDQGGKPFSVTAKSAVRDNNQFQRIYVEAPELVMGAAPGPRTTVSAGKGVYREDTRILTLDSDVHVHDTQGNDFLTSHAEINTLTDDLEGQAPIAGHGPMGRIASSSYAVHNGGAQILFTGHVVARIEQGAPPPPKVLALKGPR